MSEEKKKKIDIVKTILLMSFIVVAGLIIWLVTHKKETYISNPVADSDYSILECSSSSPENPFFAFGTAQRFTHSMKIMFTDGHMKEMSYRYDGTFNNEASAENAEAWLHADYNKYMTSNGLNAESLNPVFSIDKSKLMVSLYAEAKKIDKTVGRLFFIGDSEINKISEYTPDSFKEMYETKGFACKKE